MSFRWGSDDPMPLCPPCLVGGHMACPDLMETEGVGLHACGCTHKCHDWKYEIASSDVTPEQRVELTLAGMD